MPAVLVVTKDSGARQLVSAALSHAGHEAVTADGPDSALRVLFSIQVDALVLDCSNGGCEEMQGVAEWVRNRDRDLGVVYLTSQHGAVSAARSDRDEFVSRPFTSAEVTQAVGRVLKIGSPRRSQSIMIGDLQMDPSTLELRSGSAMAPLTSTEFNLLEYLAERQGTIVSTAELMENVWQGSSEGASSERLRAHVRNLRAKLRTLVPDREMIRTVPRRGYRLL